MLGTQACLFNGRDIYSCFPPRRVATAAVNKLVSFPLVGPGHTWTPDSHTSLRFPHPRLFPWALFLSQEYPSSGEMSHLCCNLVTSTLSAWLGPYLILFSEYKLPSALFVHMGLRWLLTGNFCTKLCCTKMPKNKLPEVRLRFGPALDSRDEPDFLLDHTDHSSARCTVLQEPPHM